MYIGIIISYNQLHKKNSLVILLIIREEIGLKDVERPVIKLEGIEKFLSGPIIGSTKAERLLLSQIKICYNHQH